jgi:UDP:flavonoid glycosyltransferase YjiC (YdhE family)
MLEIFLKPVPHQVAAVREALEQQQTDVILSESMFAGMIAFVGDASTPPVVNLGIVPLGVKSRDTAPFGLGIPPMPGPGGRLRNAMMTFVAERVIFAPVQKEAQRLALELTGRPMPGFFLDWPSRADAVVQFTVPSFEYPRSDLPGTVHFVGPVSTSAPAVSSNGAARLPTWWSDLDGSKPVVHVSQGTVANQDYNELIVPTMEALADEDVIVVVTTGGRRVSTIPGRIPPNVRLAEYLPYDELLPRTSVFITNGGYGGVHFAMRHGVPIVVAGMTEDKAEVSARIAWTGVGVNLRTNRPKPEQVAQAVRTVLADRSYADASARIGRDIAAAPGVGGILPILEAVLRDRSVAR